MVWKIVAGFILAIVCGPAILAFVIPAATRLSAFCFISGGLQIALGVTLYLMIFAGGVNWPWPLLIAVLGLFYVSRGMVLRHGAARLPRATSKIEPAEESPTALEPRRAAAEQGRVSGNAG